MVHWFSVAANSFFDLAPRFESDKLKKLTKHIPIPTWIYRFREFRRWRPAGNQIHFNHELRKSPRGRYYFTAGPPYQSCNMTRARSERPPAGPEKYTDVLGDNMSEQKHRFFKFSKNAIFSNKFCHMTDPRGPLMLRRCEFIFRFGTTARTRWT